MNTREWTNSRGQPITTEMVEAAQAIALEHGRTVSEEVAKGVLDVGLPYSIHGVENAAKAAGIPQWMADLMLDSAIAAIA